MPPYGLNRTENASRELVQGLCALFSLPDFSCPGPGNSVPSAVHGRAWTKNRENNPMQSRADPARSTLAALRPGKESLIWSRSGA